MIQVSAETFDITPRPGESTDSLTANTTTAIHSPLKTTVILLADEQSRLCFVTTPCYADSYPFSNLVRQRLGAILNLHRDRISVFSSHNHNCVMVSKIVSFADQFPEDDRVLREDELTDFGRQMVRGLEETAGRLMSKLVPVQMEWSVGHERRVAYNRKGHRADNSTYLMREEDRVLLGQDFNGDIDDDAPVLAFKDRNGKAVCFLTQFTAHPATAYHPEEPVVFGDFAQVACEDLSAAYGGVPVGFLQGCAGEINAKFFLMNIPVAERVANATRLGHFLGETYIAAAKQMQPSRRADLGVGWERVRLPFTEVPSERKLRADIAVMKDFIDRCAKGDENTRDCLGLHTASNMSPQYRSRLVEPCLRWAEWALKFHTENRLADAPEGVDTWVGAFRIGDVGIVGLQAEPFLGIGRQIRHGTKLPLAIPVGYMNDNICYVPDSPNVGDTDYQSSYYRYTSSYLPYKKPCGDLLARAGLRQLKNITTRVRRVQPV